MSHAPTNRSGSRRRRATSIAGGVRGRRPAALSAAPRAGAALSAGERVRRDDAAGRGAANLRLRRPRRLSRSRSRRFRSRTNSRAHVRIDGRTTTVAFEEHEHAARRDHRDNNMRAAIVHVLADAAVSVAGDRRAAAGARVRLALDGSAGRHHRRLVIASWSAALIRDTGAILLDMNPDRRMADRRSATRSRRTATPSPTCTSGGSAPAISARSSRW